MFECKSGCLTTVSAAFFYTFNATINNATGITFEVNLIHCPETILVIFDHFSAGKRFDTCSCKCHCVKEGCRDTERRSRSAFIVDVKNLLHIIASACYLLPQEVFCFVIFVFVLSLGMDLVQIFNEES